MVGIAGSGKTTLTRLAFPHHEHISLDIIRKLSPGTRQRLLDRFSCPVGLVGLSMTRRIEHVMMTDAITGAKNIVVDDTNLTRKIRRRHIELARMHGYKARAVFFQNVLRAYGQNRSRHGKDRLEDKVLNMQHSQLEPPHEDEGLDFIQIMC